MTIVAVATATLATVGNISRMDAHAGTYSPGIDVSHWQGTITWSKVKAAGIRFAIAKATEGKTYNDPQYARNRRRALRNGILFTAYHFARPDGSEGDARIEADHLVDVAKLKSGNLIPALDLEDTGGLGKAALQKWVWRWLKRVTYRLNGVKPMIYTSPYFWETYMGNSRAYADAGYKTLWIAHWKTQSPRVPAENWGGNGWTFWQWTNCWKVNGIEGCVDGDRYNGTNFTRVKIP
ncbi:MAG: glycoside hydrolase family 25 protein [Actinomycetota bacterium]|nr:glycoside hydrolase family 25 protein [Actinomycetota bacterium]